MRHESLAEQKRPHSPRDYVGQRHFLTDGFWRMIEQEHFSGLLFWGPPGSGKTSLVRVIAEHLKSHPFAELSAVDSGVKDIREKMEASLEHQKRGGPRHILFIDEFHRLNRGQQDILLPALEKRTIALLAATTENPSFEVNAALLSRLFVYALKKLTPELIFAALESHLHTCGIHAEKQALQALADGCDGDMRRVWNWLEQCLAQSNASPEQPGLTLEHVATLLHQQGARARYDKDREMHYDTISALIKSVRGSDPQAAVYYLARMIQGGEDPVFIARRLMILAAEDIGLADPFALVLATSAFQAAHALGMPEARIILSEAALYLACAPKSNRSYQAINDALAEVEQSGSVDIPLALRNAPTEFMKQAGYGQGYLYPHDLADPYRSIPYLPSSLRGRQFYKPSNQGKEESLSQLLKYRLEKTP